GFQHESDARCFLDALRQRLAEFALSLHPEKTRLIEFGRYAAQNRKRRGLGKPETFNFLGFTFICGKSRKGGFLIKRKTRRDQMVRIADAWLPQPRILHPWPNQRFAVRHPRWEPYAGKLHVRICAGGAR